ncbi:unnamed protein product [Callosobruchus maculatus]|uniref:Uncharacterized protein n=1 Tax=Callosobruchus maculatus TaxID=64391 RepID=A0A653D7W3_CALMS|nr:unnamed protein product [Callosobruchus maculatus]
MDETDKIEELELGIAGEEFYVKTEMKTSTSLIVLDIKNEIDTDEKIESLKHEHTINENQDGNDLPIIPDNLIKIEKVEPEMYAEEPGCYMGTVQLNEELSIKNEIFADSESSYQDFKRIKTEHNSGEWNESVLAVTNMAVKPDPDASTLHTELDVKNESNPSTSAVLTTGVTKNEILRKKRQ